MSAVRPPAAVPGERRSALALVALFAGALAIGFAGILVRLSETGPAATAFWRGLFALPLLALWSRLERRDGAPAAPWSGGFVLAGACFGGDLALWHEALLRTQVGAATLESNLAPLFVTLFAWLLWRERPSARFVVALALALAGLALIVAPKLGAAPEGPAGAHSLLGDALGVGSGVFYAGYLLAVASLRAGNGAGLVMLRSTLVYTVLLLPLAATQRFLPETTQGWLVLCALGVFVHAVGQGLIAWALAHLPATFGSLGLYVQPVAATVYAALLLGERLAAIQLVGAAVVLAAVALARSAQRR